MEEESLSMSTAQKLQLKYDVISGKYLDLIADLRDKARDTDAFCHGRPVLPLETDANPPYIEVYLQEGGMDKGFAKIRRYDLRLINYEDPFGNLFNADEFQLYDDDSRLVKFGIEGLLLGLPAFINAFNYLANVCKEQNVDVRTSFLVKCDSLNLTNLKENSDVRTSLAVLCLVLCEATKLDLFSCMLGNAFKSGFEVPLSSWLLERINDWEFFSMSLNDDNEHDDSADCNFYLHKLYIEVDLTEAGNNGVISKGKISWTETLREDYYDSRITAMVNGTNGYAIVYFMVCSNAIQALVEATLLIKDGHPHVTDDVCVCGRLSVLYSDLSYAADFHEKYYQIRLFDKPVNKESSAFPCKLDIGGMCNRVKLQEAINLSRSRVAVPVDSSLIIKADLKNCEGKPIVTGSMEWIPKELGEFEGTMEGHANDSHLLHVKVKWIEC